MDSRIHVYGGVRSGQATGLEHIAERLRTHGPATSQGQARFRAAVALILRAEPEGVRLLFIERAHHDGDPWSGDVALPGGKVEEEDGGPRHTAERETYEEIGLDLSAAQFLGRLDDVAGANLPVIVSPFVYHLPQPSPLTLSEEVQEAFWVDLDGLLDPRRHRIKHIHFRGRDLIRSAIDLPGPDRPLLWGLTYRVIASFFAVLGHDLPPNDPAIVSES